MKLTLQSDAQNEPVSLTEAKKFLRVDHNEEDLFIDALIKTARNHAEQITGTALTTQVWHQRVYGLDDYISLYKSPIISIDSVQYYDLDEVLQTLSTSLYSVKKNDRVSYIERVKSESFPSVAKLEYPVLIEFTAGFVEVTPTIKTAILQHIGFMYENRQLESVPKALGYLLQNDRVYYC